MKISVAMAMIGLTAATEAHAGAIVTARNSPLPEINAEQARKIFLGREFSLNGQSLVLIYQGEGAVRRDFEVRILDKTGADLTSHWSKLIFTGKASPPMEAGGDDGVKALVGRMPGSLGYVSDGAVDNSVKVLFKY